VVPVVEARRDQHPVQWSHIDSHVGVDEDGEKGDEDQIR
jgi:hypothetical protein